MGKDWKGQNSSAGWPLHCEFLTWTQELDISATVVFCGRIRWFLDSGIRLVKGLFIRKNCTPHLISQTAIDVITLQELLQGNIDHSSFSVNKLQESILGSCAKEDDSKLPQTGMPQAVEKEFSSIFIKPTQILGQPYGTHTQTVILGWASNEVEYYERAFIPIADSAVEESDGSAENDKNRTSVHRFSVPITNAWRVGQLG